MYSQKAQVAIMQVGGAPTVLPKEPTERLKLVATAVDAITEPPPKRTHTRTTKGGASTSGSAQDPIPDPGVAPKSLVPRVAVPTMAPWGAEIGMGRSLGAACRPRWGRTRRARGGRPTELPPGGRPTAD